jgi:hypothetical protein
MKTSTTTILHLQHAVLLLPIDRFSRFDLLEQPLGTQKFTAQLSGCVLMAAAECWKSHRRRRDLSRVELDVGCHRVVVVTISVVHSNKHGRKTQQLRSYFLNARTKKSASPS